MTDRPVLLCIAVLALVVLVPALLFPLPPIIDYPNHLARIWLISGGVDIPPVNTFYFEDWHEVGAGIGIDLIAKLLSPFLAPFTIGLVLLIGAMLLPPLGAIALNAKLYGLNAWQPFFLLFWCAQTLIGGFLNFQIGLGLALLAIAADPMAARYGPWARYGLRFVTVFVLMLIHPYGLFFYTCLLAATTFGKDWPARREIPRRLAQAGVAAAVALLPVIVFFLRVRGVPGSEDKVTKAAALFNDPFGVVQALASPFASYDRLVDLGLALPFAALVIWGLWRKKFDAHAGLVVLAAIFMAVAAFMPATLGHTGWIDKRFPLLAVLTALAATRLNVDVKRQNWLLAAAALMVMARTAWVALNWNAFVPLTDSMREALTEVPEGARVLAMHHENTDRVGLLHVIGRTAATLDETYRHYPALMVPWRHAFTPMLFAQYREKPILLRPDFARIANPTGGVLPSVNALTNKRLVTARLPYVKEWRSSFDYVLVLNADRPDRYGPFTPPDGLTLVADKGFAQLWRVR